MLTNSRRRATSLSGKENPTFGSTKFSKTSTLHIMKD